MNDQIDDRIPSPWQVGQRIQERNNPAVRGVVTELTDKGFKYKLDFPQSVGPASWGQTSEEGEIYCYSWEPYGGFEIEAVNICDMLCWLERNKAEIKYNDCDEGVRVLVRGYDVYGGSGLRDVLLHAMKEVP